MSGAPLGAGIERRIFVVGAPRSGTTLVQSLLAAHDATTSFTESHFFAGHFKLLPRPLPPLLVRDPGPRLHRFLAENGEQPPESAVWLAANGSAAGGSRALLPLRTRPVARRLLRVLDELTVRRDKRCWIEKTPRHLRYLPFLERLGGAGSGMRFVHVIRDGLEVVASLYRASRQWERPYDLAACVRRWNADLRFSLGRAAAPNDLFVFYEELTAAPEATLERLLAGLGLAWQAPILERYPAVAGRLVTAGERGWKQSVGRQIRGSRTAERTLSKEQLRTASAALRGGLYRRLRRRAAAREDADG